jgi:hypothetical protein
MLRTCGSVDAGNWTQQTLRSRSPKPLPSQPQSITMQGKICDSEPSIFNWGTESRPCNETMSSPDFFLALPEKSATNLVNELARPGRQGNYQGHMGRG